MFLIPPQVDWDLVAERTGYNSGTTAKVRYGQIKRAIGIKEYGTIERAPAAAKPRAKKVDENGNPIVTPRKPRAKKEKEVGSGTNKTPSKVTKAHTSKSKLSPAKVNDGMLIDDLAFDGFRWADEIAEDAEGDNDELAGSPGDDPFAVKAQAGAGEMFIDAPYEQQS